jgi:hypothetical protein
MVPYDIQERLRLLGDGERKTSLKILSCGYANHLGAPAPNLLKPEWRNAIKSYLLENAIKIFVIDNIASLTPGIDEKLKEQWGPINQWLLELRFEGITTILLHHHGKRGHQWGTSAREDNVDVSMDLVGGSAMENGCRFIAKFTKTRIPTHDLPLVADFNFWLKFDGEGLILPRKSRHTVKPPEPSARNRRGKGSLAANDGAADCRRLQYTRRYWP